MMEKKLRDRLRARWRSEVRPGESYAERLTEVLRRSPPSPPATLAEQIQGLTLAEEVAPALDLRGFSFPRLLVLRDLELSGARLDFAIFGGMLDHCRLRGAILDHCDGAGATFHFDLSSASLTGAKLRGASFVGSDLTSANLSMAQLVSARLMNAQCPGANFEGADLRYANLANADLRGADFRGANLADASLGGVAFDASTCFFEANLAGAAMDAELVAYTCAGGVNTEHSYALAEFDATVVMLKQRGHHSSLLVRLADLRKRLLQDPSFDWGTILSEELPPALMAEVVDAVAEAGKSI